MTDDAAPLRRDIALPDADATARVGAALARALRPGDAVLLSGGLGAGKSALARAGIAALLAEDGRREDIPSPTFTLVQAYETARGPVWHADLYRLASAEEATELGLDQAFREAICFIEWAERLGPAAPRDALRANLDFGDAEDARVLTLTGPASRWKGAVDAAEAAA